MPRFPQASAYRRGSGPRLRPGSEGTPDVVIGTGTSQHRDPDEQFREMKRLLERAERFAVTIRDELTALDSMRKEALAEVQREADEIRAEALEEADGIRTRAEEEAREIVERAHSAAASITAAAHDELARIEPVLSRYREAVETARALFSDLPEVPSQRSPNAKTPDANAPATDPGDRPSANGESPARVEHVMSSHPPHPSGNR